MLVRVRNPVALMGSLQRKGFTTPRTRATPPGGSGTGAWLLKPRRSGGGHGTRPWRSPGSVPRTHYLQQRISGLPGSVVFAADGLNAVPLGLTRQLVGDAHFGAVGFRYCGSLLGPSAELFAGGNELVETSTRLAAAVTEEFGLLGLNGIDFISHDGVPYPIEVNPRYSASMELLERAHRLSLFEVHAEACRGSLPPQPLSVAGVEGKAIVFARRDVTVPGTRSWIESEAYADLPRPGERILRGRPICTVFAWGSDAAACYRLLVRRATGVYRAMESTKRSAA